MSRTAIGFRVKSGYAIAVVLGGSAETPRAIARHIVEMSDPKAPGTRQPYHNRMFKTEEDEGEIARRLKIVKRCAVKSVTALITQTSSATLSRLRSRYGEARRSAGGAKAAGSREHRANFSAALVVGSVVDPATIGSPHMRAHANEGRLFRTVLEDALRSHGIACDVVVEKTLAKRATADLGRSDREIKKVVDEFGETLGRPWRAEEKAAATAAWIVLTRRTG
ncbi:MAG: hypothetical protein HY047_05755 [Acidobacteria bacterium]|nr:hypothetical protein [Acidobacteriota bacterium]